MAASADEETVEALVARAQALETPLAWRQAAFEALVRRYQDLAYGYAYALLHEPHLAQDATQEAFLAAYRNLAQLREPPAFAGWLRRIVRTYCLRLRRTKEPPLVALDRLAELRSEPGDPSAPAEAHERRAFVATVLEALPAHERTATVLFYLGGYSQLEIAAFLGVTVMTVKKRL